MTPNSSAKDVWMIDRADAEAVLYRVAVASFTYYPEKAVDQPGYAVDEDVDWCIEPLHHAPADVQIRLRECIRVMITDRLADRQAFMRELKELAA